MYFKKQNNLLAIALLFWVVVLAGCAPQTQFVVLRDVPESPSFVVIPANDYLHEVVFANEVENAIISAGVKVVMRPVTKDDHNGKNSSGCRRQARPMTEH